MTPAFWGYPPPPNDYPYSWFILDPKSKEDKVNITNWNYEFWNKHYMRHTFWSCFIRCANMKWIPQVLLKIPNGRDSVHRQTDGQTDGWTDARMNRWADRQGETSIPLYLIANMRLMKGCNASGWWVKFKHLHLIIIYNLLPKINKVRVGY